MILDPRNGEVLALVSLPAYDPNAFAAGIDRAAWSRLNTDRLRPLQNRAIQGRYSPGSTFKVVVATAALEEGLITPDYKVYCPGGATFYDRFFQCNVKGGHGVVDLRHAIEKSCNVYFYTIGNMVGVDRMNKWAQALGLAGRTGIDLPNEAESLVPSTAWKKAKTGEKWYAGETISVAIGQGQVSVTPVALAALYAAVANGGVHYPPHLLRATNNGGGWRAAPAPQALGVKLKPETIAALHDGLWLVVNGAGTGGRARIEGMNVAGKTGTAQVISLQGGKAGRRQDGPGPARPRVVRVLRAARQPRDCRCHPRGARRARRQRGADRAAHHRNVSRGEGGEAAARVPGAGRARTAGDRRAAWPCRACRGAGTSRGAFGEKRCSNAGSTCTWIGRSWERSTCCASSAS